MTFLDDSERQLYLKYREKIKAEYLIRPEYKHFKGNAQMLDGHYGKTISREAKELIKDKREKEKVDMIALLRGI